MNKIFPFKHIKLFFEKAEWIIPPSSKFSLMLFRQRKLDTMKGVTNLHKGGLGSWPDNRVDMSPDY